jgi:pimeloyl-ACP methyl ester carboxylesterase
MQRELHPATSSGRAISHDLRADRTRRFRIDVDQDVLDDLKLRLDRTRWAHVTEQSGWGHGTSTAYLRELVDHWRTGYDWRRHEARLNACPQIVAQVDGEELHAVHVRGRGPRATPLLLLHGWPDSFLRYLKVIPLLVDPATPGESFEVVVPSLPGFAFTGPLRRQPREQPTRHIAQLLWRLMTDVLGHERFAVAGGDGGSVLAQILAIDHPESVTGIHLTDLGWHTWRADPSSLSRSEQRFIASATRQVMADGAYAMVQQAWPRSIGVGLDDSPVGLASWIVDRFHAWADGDIETRFSREDVLTNIMLYWVTQTMGSSVQLYHAEARSPSLTPADRVERPVGLALFPKEIGGVPPRSFAERTLNVQHWSVQPRGGHLGPLEEPALYARDVVAFFRSLSGGRAAT